MAKRKSGLNKMALVREAMSAGIQDAAGIVEYLGKRGAKMSSQMASNYKSSIKKKGKGSSNSYAKKAAKVATAPMAVAKTAPAPAPSGVMATLKAARTLLHATGSASAAKEVLDLLG
jgi:hypothetical protein